MTTREQVIAQMLDAGLPALPADHPKLDGKIHRFGKGKKCWYVLREVALKSGNVSVTGAFGQYHGQDNGAIKVRLESDAMSKEERAEYAAKRVEIERKEAEEQARLHHLSANRAKDQWSKAIAIEGDKTHPYLIKKQVPACGVRLGVCHPTKDMLLIPLHKNGGFGEIAGLQKITNDGEKFYNEDLDKIGAAFRIESTNVPAAFENVEVIGEGYATCVSAQLATQLTVTVAYDAGNILHVARALRAQFPHKHLLLLADDDYLLQQRFVRDMLNDFEIANADEIAINGIEHVVQNASGEYVQVTAIWKKDACSIPFIEVDVRVGRQCKTRTFKNAGVSCCMAAAKEVGNASVVFPVFETRNGEKWTDFNDLHVIQSLDAVASQINAALARIVAPVDVAAIEGVDAFTLAAQQLHDNASPLKGQPPAPTSAEAPQFDGVPVFDDSPPPPSEVMAKAGLLAEGEGVEKQPQEKPKKVYGKEHWAAVEDALDNFILIYGEDMVWDCRQRMLMKLSSMRTIISNSDVMKFWSGNARKWVLKRNIVFDPTETPSPALTGATATVNLFSGWKMQPKQGNCLQIQTLLAHLVDGNEDMYLWILRWLAYPLRHRGAKMETSIIMHGDEGSGKNFFFEKVIKAIYGDYGYVIGNAQLESQFNDWASMKLFMVADEVVTRSELRHMKGKLKYLVSGDTIIVNPKGLPEHSEANHINFVFLSNELQPLALDKTDRRYLVLWTPPALPREFYVGVADEIRNGGIEAFYHHLMYEVDMGDFDQHTKPLYNEAKDNLIEKSLTPAERFYREWSGGFLPLPFITCGATQLFDAFKTWCDRSGESRFISQTLFGTQLARYAGVALVKKLIKYELGEVVKQRWVFLVGDKPEDKKTLADWVADASNLFDGHLKKYRGRGGSLLDGADDVSS
jgi:putative DNA primase/helicase